jgi:dihydrofolate reductase
MGIVRVFTNLTLDGVMQAPARPDEDRRGGFDRGGWAAPYAAMASAGEAMSNIGGLLLGRRTYEDFYAVWPKRTESPYSAFMDNIPKYVASTTLTVPLPWSNSVLLEGEVGTAVSRLKAELVKDLVIMGSGVLVQSLMARNLVDEFVLLVHPLVLGSGHRLFPDGGAGCGLELGSSKAIPNGVVIATYRAKGKLSLG